jgi:hypothetical protein
MRDGLLFFGVLALVNSCFAGGIGEERISVGMPALWREGDYLGIKRKSQPNV